MLRLAFLTTTAICTAAIASADTISFNDVHGWTGAGPTVTGSFDLSGFVQDQADLGFDVTMNSARVSLLGYSAANNSYSNVRTGSFRYLVTESRQGSNYVPPTYTCGFWGASSCGNGYTNYYTYYVEVFRYDGSEYTNTTGDVTPDNVVVDFGDTILSGNTDGPLQYAGTSSAGPYSRTRTIYRRGYDYGPETDQANLLPADFARLINDLELTYSFRVTTGEYDSVSLTLDLNYDLALRAPAPVPLPASLLLLTGSIGALGAMRSRRRKARALT